MKRLQINPGFAAAMLFAAWLDTEIALWLLGGILFHELGHWVALKLCRVTVHGVRFQAWGVVMDTEETTYGRELICAMAGPAASLLLGLCLMRLWPRGAVISFLLAAINLLPLFPLDGGRALRCLLMLLLPYGTACQFLRLFTFCTCGGLMLLACWASTEFQAGLWPIFAALFLLCRAGHHSLTTIAAGGKIC